MAWSSWGDDADQAHVRLMEVVAKIDEYLAACRRGRLRGKPPSEGPAGLPSARAGGSLAGGSPTAAPATADRRRLAEIVLPAIRGALGIPDRVILHYDDGEDVLAALADERTPELTARGMATPEHLLRAGRLPVWLDLDLAAPPDDARRPGAEPPDRRAKRVRGVPRPSCRARRAPARRLGQGRSRPRRSASSPRSPTSAAP